MKYYRIFIISFILLNLSCGTEKFVEPDTLNTPLNLLVYPKNNSIKIKFYSSNKENHFDGFNLYLSTSSSLKSQYELLPVKNPHNGNIPTIISANNEIKLGHAIEETIYLDPKDEHLENGITYFLVVRAHSYRNYKSTPSNEVSTTPRYENTTGILLNDNEGFNLETRKKIAPYHFIFSVINGKKYIIGKNHSMILSKGYYENWELVNKADLDGYFDSDLPLQIKNGYVYLIKTQDNKFGKIRITYVSDTQIKFIWAFQQISNNRDI